MIKRSQGRVDDGRRRRRGRPKLYDEHLNLSLPAGTIARIDAVRREDEDRLTLIRAAIEREIRRRESR